MSVKTLQTIATLILQISREARVPEDKECSSDSHSLSPYYCHTPMLKEQLIIFAYVNPSLLQHHHSTSFCSNKSRSIEDRIDTSYIVSIKFSGVVQ